MVTWHDVRELVEYDSKGSPVVSLYLNVDGSIRSPIKYAEVLHQLVRSVRTEQAALGADETACAALDADLAEITRFVGAEFNRESWRGLALFSCRDQGFWRAFRLPHAVADTVQVCHRAYVRPLVELMSTLGRSMVAFVDRRAARFFCIDLGSITELEGLQDDVPGRVRVGSTYGVADSKIEHSIDEQIRRHVQHAVEHLDRHVTHYQPDRIILAGSPDVLPQFRRLLTNGLARLVVGEAHGLMAIAKPDDVFSEAMETIRRSRSAEDATAIRRIREVAGPGGLGVLSTDATLRALFFGAVYELVVDGAVTLTGHRCVSCGRMYAEGCACPECGESRVEAVDDVIESAVELAITQDARIRFIGPESERIGMDGLGALLHFPLPQAAAYVRPAREPDMGSQR